MYKKRLISIIFLAFITLLIINTSNESPLSLSNAFAQEDANPSGNGYEGLNNSQAEFNVDSLILPSGTRPFLQRQPVQIGNALIHFNSFFDHRLPVSSENSMLLPPELRDADSNITQIFTGESRTVTGDCIYGYDCYSHHSGLDYNTAGNIYAPAAGRISRLVRSQQPGADEDDICAVYIKHDLSDPPDNTYEYTSAYWHLDYVVPVPDEVRNRPGRSCGTSQYWCLDDPVQIGVQIGVAGNDPCGGISGGTHLHFTLYAGLIDQAGSTAFMDPFGWWDSSTDPRSDERLPNNILIPQDSYWLWGTAPNPAPSDPGYWGDHVLARVDDSDGAFHLFSPYRNNPRINRRSQVFSIQRNSDQGVLPIGDRAWRSTSLDADDELPVNRGVWGLYVPTDGEYRIEAHIPRLPSNAPVATTSAVYTVTLALEGGNPDTWTTLSVNQQQDNAWMPLYREAGVNTFDLVGNSVVLVALDDRTGTAGETVIYDAMRLVSISQVIPPVPIETHNIGFVMDNSSSMLAEGKLGAVKSAVPPWIDALEATETPYHYAFTQFANNFTPVQATDDANVIKTLIANLNGNDNGQGNYECPEESLGAIIQIAPFTQNGDILLFTDDIPFSALIKGPQALTALIQNHARLHAIILPKTCWFDGSTTLDFLTYRFLAYLTGGSYQQLSSTNETDEALGIVLSEMQSNTELLAVTNYQSSRGLSDQVQDTWQYEALVDETVTKVNFLLEQKEGSSLSLNVYRPDGSLVLPSDPDVTYLDSGSAQYYSVLSPAIGPWQIAINGTGEFDLRVTGDSSFQYSYVGDVRAASGEWIELVAKLSEPVTSAQFDLLTTSGEVVQSVELNDAGAQGDLLANDGLYTGYYQADTSGDYRLQLTGINQSGAEFGRTDPRLIRIHNLAVIAPEAEVIPPGNYHTFVFEVMNSGTTVEIYNLYASSVYGWISNYVPSSLTLQAGESTTIDITVYVPPDAYPNQIDNINLSVVYRDDSSLANEATTSVIVPDVDTVHQSYTMFLPMLHR